MTVNPTYTTDLTQTICEGETYTVGTTDYTTSGTYTEVLTAANGCDSIVNLVLTVNPTFTTDLTQTICEGETYTVGTTDYTTSGSYTEVLTALNGCDSVVNLILTVNPTYTTDLTQTICEGETYTVGTTDYTTSGSYTEVLTAANGCDSIVNLVLTVNPTYTTDLTQIICEGEVYTCLLYTSPSPRDATLSRMPSSA